MTSLATATLQRLKRVGKPAKNKPAKVEPDGDPLPVQFNPASLKISRSNNVDRGGVTAKTQKVQNPSAEPAKLTFDLEFDTAEQVKNGEPVDVREWTALIRQFVEPPTDPQNAGKPPPAVQFAWGTLVFNGIVEQVTEELDFFAPNGTPLHAKVSLSVSEQNFAYEALAGPAKGDAKGATEPGGRTPLNAPGQATPGTSPGSKGTQDPRKLVEAVDGESAQQMLSRLGLDPEAWRGAMEGLDSPLELPAGTPVVIGAEVEGGASLGEAVQFAAGLSTSDPTGLADILGIGNAASAVSGGFGSPGANSQSRGLALAASGGIRAATDRVAGAKADAAAQQSRGSFSVESPTSGGAAPSGIGARAGGNSGGATTRPDDRGSTFGWGIPLQTRGRPATLADAQAGGQPALSARARRLEVPPSGGITPPWVALPPESAEPSTRQRPGDARHSRLRSRCGGDGP
jgi:hypothetical protein